MSDAAATEELEDGSAGGKKKLSGKKLVLFIILPLLLVLGGGGAAAYFLLLSDPAAEQTAEGESGPEAMPSDETGADAVDPSKIVFYDVPEMLVNLNTGSDRPNYLKVSVSLELNSDEGSAAVERYLPRVIDRFQIYLRELRIEDLSGSAGLVRLKEELLIRINAAVGAVVVKDILFKEMLVQ